MSKYTRGEIWPMPQWRNEIVEQERKWRRKMSLWSLGLMLGVALQALAVTTPPALWFGIGIALFANVLNALDAWKR